jgi:tetratricopeptide (TPR) repeat protein
VLISYVAYVRMAIWPARLAVYYPLAASLPPWKPIAAAVVLVVVTVAVVMSSRPYLIAGWLWYLGTLVPVIGFVQIGGRALADRYTYVPFIGLFMMVAWGIADLRSRWSLRPQLVGAAAATALVACAVTTWIQVGYWRDSATLFRHALAVAPDNFVAQANLGLALQEQGDLEAASAHLEASFALNPDADAAFNLANVRLAQQRLPEAVALYEQTLRLEPRRAKALYNLANTFDQLGQSEDAVRSYREALRIDPADVDARNNLGITLLRAGRLDEAGAEFEAALRLAPNDSVVHRNLGALYAQRQDWTRAVTEYETARRALPNDVVLIDDLSMALVSTERAGDAARLLEDAVERLPDATRLVGALAWLRAPSKDARARDGAEAVRLAERACTMERSADCLDTLAAAYAEVGRFADAVGAVRAALADADATPEFRDELRERAALYESGKPYRAP